MLSGTNDVVNSVLAFNKPTSTEVSSSLRLSAGLLHLHVEEGSSLQDLLVERGGKETSFDDAAIVGVAAATLRELSLTSGSWVRIYLLLFMTSLCLLSTILCLFMFR